MNWNSFVKNKDGTFTISGESADGRYVVKWDKNRKLISESLVPGVSKAVAFDKWPLWAKSLQVLSTSVDRGIGDTVYRNVGSTNSEKFKSWYLEKFGEDCGCGSRREDWNVTYPNPGYVAPPA